MSAYKNLVEEFDRLDHISHAITFLQWDQLVKMPPGGNSKRSEAIAELTSTRHNLLTQPRILNLIHQAKQQENSEEVNVSLQEMELTYNQAACLPTDLVKHKSLAGSRCEHGWRTQRKENDWPAFLQNFKEVVTLSREEAQARKESSTRRLETPYDAMLDLYCHGDSSEQIQSIFKDLKKELPRLINKITGKQPERKQLPKGPYSTEQQKQLNLRLMSTLGFNFNCGRLDVSAHPFSTGDRGDQRITTRFREDEFLEALTATAHETGHASYESGLPEHWQGLPIGKARNMSIHESQSLLFEKHLFLSQPFFNFFCQEIHHYLPRTQKVSPDDLWSICNYVEPSFIRVEADEVTYPLHVILRFEIERDLINGVIEAKDIPELWDQKMIKYLNLSTKGNYCDGCLQDIHWTDGSFGYFPSYTMGALNSAQLYVAFERSHPGWQQQLSHGEIDDLRNWLQKNIWSIASSLDSQEIILEASGEHTNPQYFLSHLRRRYLNE